MRALYSIGLFFALLPYLPRYLRRMGRSGPLGLGLKERLARYPEALTVKLHGKHPLWLHSVSVGETVVGSVLVSRLLARRPGLPLLVSTVSLGRAPPSRYGAGGCLLWGGAVGPGRPAVCMTSR